MAIKGMTVGAYHYSYKGHDYKRERMINGKKWLLDDLYATKGEAERKAAKGRENGYKVRTLTLRRGVYGNIARGKGLSAFYA